MLPVTRLRSIVGKGSGVEVAVADAEEQVNRLLLAMADEGRTHTVLLHTETLGSTDRWYHIITLLITESMLPPGAPPPA